MQINSAFKCCTCKSLLFLNLLMYCFYLFCFFHVLFFHCVCLFVFHKFFVMHLRMKHAFSFLKSHDPPGLLLFVLHFHQVSPNHIDCLGFCYSFFTCFLHVISHLIFFFLFLLIEDCCQIEHQFTFSHFLKFIQIQQLISEFSKFVT